MLGIPKGITSYGIELKICDNKRQKLKSVSQKLRKKKRKSDKTVFLAKSKLYSIKLLISKASIYSSISDEKFILTNNVVKEYHNLKEEIKNVKIETVL